MSVRVLHVNNISPCATKDQIQTLFSYIGRIEDFRLYPSDFPLTQANQQPKFAYIKFEDERGVEVGQHLTNTVFLDRALVCVPGQSNEIPEEENAIQGGVLALPGQRQLPPHISNQLQELGEGQKMIVTVDPNLTALGLPAYPPLPPTTEPSKVEEIRRTVYVGNLPKGYDGEELLAFFNNSIGEVMYMRMAAGNDQLPCDYAYVEFSQQSSVPLALQNSDTLEFEGRMLRIQHSKVAIIKPQRKTAEQSLEEVEEAIRGGAIASTVEIGPGYEPFKPGVSAPLVRKTSPAPVATSSAAASRKGARSRSRSYSSRSRSRSRRDRSRSNRRSRRRSHSRSRSSSYSRSRRRSRSRSQRRRSHSRSRKRSSRYRSRSRKRSTSRDRKRKRSRSRDRSAKKESSSKSSKREKDREKERSGKKDEEKREKASSSKKDRKRSHSPSISSKKDRRRSRSSSVSSTKKSRKRSRSRSPKKERKESRTPKKEKSEREEKTDKKSGKRSSTERQLKPKKEVVSEEKMETTQEMPQRIGATSTGEFEEEESLRERLLERVKLKHSHQKDE